MSRGNRPQSVPPAAWNLVERLCLEPHPEGGFFRETYRSCELLTSLPPRFPGPRSVATAIYYLLSSGDCSAFHRIRSDEMWHFYSGEALCIHVLHDRKDRRQLSDYERLVIGEGLHFQTVVPAGAWFAAEPLGEYALVGCTVAPGFDFADFEMADRDQLVAEFPENEDLIRRLTR